MTTDLTPETGEVLLSTQVAEEIRSWMARRKLRPAQLARRLGKNQVWISVRLNGVVPVRLDELPHFAEVLGVAVPDLLPEGMLRVWANKRYAAPKRDPLATRVIVTAGQAPKPVRPAGKIRATRPPNRPSRSSGRRTPVRV